MEIKLEGRLFYWQDETSGKTLEISRHVLISVSKMSSGEMQGSIQLNPINTCTVYPILAESSTGQDSRKKKERNRNIHP